MRLGVSVNGLECSRVVFGLAFLLTGSALGCSLPKTSPVGVGMPELFGHVQAEPEPSPGERGETDSSGDVLTVTKSLAWEVVSDLGYLITSPLRLEGKSALMLGGVAAGIGGLMVVDADIQKVAQRNRTGSSDDASEVLHDLGSAAAVFGGNLALIGTGWWLRETEAGDKLLQAALLSFEAQVFTEAIAGMTKIAAGRSRPNAGDGAHFYRPFGDFTFDRSFPSSHAARAFAVAAVFSDRYDQPVPFLAYTTATLIALSRVSLNEHFASDVFAGAALGFTLGKILSFRHRYQPGGLAILPYLPDAEGSLGLAVQYIF